MAPSERMVVEEPKTMKPKTTDLHRQIVASEVAKAHIESFNFMISKGLPLGIKNIRPLEMLLPNNDKLNVKVVDIVIGKPRVPKDCVTNNKILYPSECRMRGTSYRAKVEVAFVISINGSAVETISESVGEIPIMLKSVRCNLDGMTPKQLIKVKEDAAEFGGYFIQNGGEKIIRLLTAQRRNYPLGLSRNSWKESGQLFSEYGISIRCVREDQIGSNMVLHYLNNGTARLKVFYARKPFFFPIVMILKSLMDVSDQYIYDKLTRGLESDTFYCSCCVNMLSLLKGDGEESLRSREDVLNFIGKRFRVFSEGPEWWTDAEAAMDLIKTSVCVNLVDNEDKFNLLIQMVRKLFAIAKGKSALENPDNPMFHEVFPSGHIYFTLLLERLEMLLQSIKPEITRVGNSESMKSRASGSSLASFVSGAMIKRILTSKFGTITSAINHLISTGNLLSKSGLGLQQISGICVAAEKINYWRFLSHFRAVHRGSFFTEMRTTACRKLYPEAWGFLCPVHTPDGTPCGLLNHLSELCEISSVQPSVKALPSVLVSLGMVRLDDPCGSNKYEGCLEVSLDGRLIGFVHSDHAKGIVDKLRVLKATPSTDQSKIPNVPPTLEIGFIPPTEAATQYPGIFMFSTPARMLRPVRNLTTETIELIGSFEQPYLEICVINEEAHVLTTHQELRQTSFLSILAAQIPFPDHNQSPRNMYSCQMGKQTMGTPSHTLKYRSDTKMYGVNYTQCPLVAPILNEDKYNLDEYPMGSNGVVAVISYTGYDMEDALILNKASVERGFKHGWIQKTHITNLREIDSDSRDHGRGGSMSKSNDDVKFMFGKPSGWTPGHELSHGKIAKFLDDDGLPITGSKLSYGDPLCCFYEVSTGNVRVEEYKSTEEAYIWDVKLLGSDNGQSILQTVAITLYINRSPSIGDKFANRHGQKGVCSFLWPQENMPFATSGMTPDIIFNPHGYPSRMTIGMMIESMAGKTGASIGTVHDATPFTFGEDNPAAEHYGKLLESLGYNYYGTERMYSGVDGRELKADIFVGVLYYIRLRHMVGDKYQVRSTGPIDQITHQPLKGRKRAGGIRFGEMERDALLAHGTSFLLHDRLFNCSDRSVAYGCTKCGSLLSTYLMKPELISSEHNYEDPNETWFCRTCNSRNHVKQVLVPYVLRYLVAELASVNIKINFKFN